jgi:hypothetical protein
MGIYPFAPVSPSRFSFNTPYQLNVWDELRQRVHYSSRTAAGPQDIQSSSHNAQFLTRTPDEGLLYFR